MKRKHQKTITAHFIALFLLVALSIQATAHGLEIQTKYTRGCFAIATTQAAAPLIYDAIHDHSVVGLAAKAVAVDINDICGQEPKVLTSTPRGTSPILAGTIGQSTLIDTIVSAGKIDVSDIQGKWEAYKLEVVKHPIAGISQALVIVGSTPRGTAYGLFHLSRLMGVSPWKWWADVVPQPRSALYATAGRLTVDEPSVRFRGIFLNDEDWGLQPWAAKKMDTDIRDIGPHTYEHIFELMLRLRANFLWPAMHPCTKAFWFYPENPILAKQYDIVLGSSHCEPMLRNNVFEWFNEGGNHENYNFATHADSVTEYWRRRVVQSQEQDAVYTLGMRGVHDGAISGYRGADNIANALSSIIATQRRLIAEHIGDPTKIPQMFCPYKEVLNAYNTGGISLPDDITLTWVDDNHGYIRQFPNAAEQARSGSNGIYYHLSYWGSPRDYLWLSSISPTLISYELCRGYQQGIRRLWVINVGDIKPAEEELEFCMDLAWDVNKWNPTQAYRYSRDWAARTFGTDMADEIGAIKQEYYRLAAMGKPEHVAFVQYRHHERAERMEAYLALVQRVANVKERIPKRLQDAYFQLVEYPVCGACLMNIKHFRATESKLLAEAGMKTEALAAAAEAQAAYNEIQQITTTYNTDISGGKWDGMMSSHPRNQSAFDMPKVATADDVANSINSFETEDDVVIPATKYVKASPSLKALNGLGFAAPKEGESAALTPWPMDLNAYSPDALSQAPCAEYNVPVSKGNNIVCVRCLPTFPLNSSYDLRYAISIGNSEPTIKSIRTTATSPTWNQNVLRGWAGANHSYMSEAEKKIRVRIYFMDPGLVLCDIRCQRPIKDRN